MTPHTAAPTLCVCISALLVLAVTGFEFRSYENPPFNRKLICSVDANSFTQNIFTIIDLTIFDVTNSRKAKKVAGISVHDTDLYIGHASKRFLAVEGSVSQHYANLVVTFRNQSYCLLCSYMCELNFINPDGHPVVRHSTVKSPPAGSNSSYSSDVSVDATNQMTAAVDRLAGITLDVEDRLVDRLAQLEEKLDNITGLLTPEVMKEKGLGLTTRTSHTEECREGMANVTSEPRILVKILDNKPALCDTETEGGGWIIFQRRIGGREKFHRPWTDYVSGFGDIEGGGDYWLGLQSIHELTSQETFELLVEMKKDGKSYYARYSSFKLGNVFSKYQLSIGDYTGNSTDSLDQHRNRRFSTVDNDNDDDSSENCAYTQWGGWWFASCGNANLNGDWREAGEKGVKWSGVGVKMSMTEMKIRRVQ